MQPRPERKVPCIVVAEVKLGRLRIDARVPVAGGLHHEQDVAASDFLVVPVEILGRNSRLRRGHGRDAHDLADAAQDLLGVGAHEIPRPRAAVQGHDAQGHRVVRRVVAGDQQERQGCQHLVRGERIALLGGVEQLRQQILARLSPALIDRPQEHLVHLRHCPIGRFEPLRART